MSAPSSPPWPTPPTGLARPSQLRQGLAAAIAVAATVALVQPALGQPGAGQPAPAPHGPAAQVEPPVLVHFEPALYPEAAQREGLTASVLLELAIDSEGAVTDVKVVATEPPAAAVHPFADAAALAARRLRFRPARQGGEPVAVRIRYRYRFVLQATKAPSPAAPPVSAPGAPPTAAPGTPEPGVASAPPAAPPVALPEVLAGQVLARGSRDPVPLAEVHLEPVTTYGRPPPPLTILADEQGRFSVRGRLSGRFRVRVRAFGHLEFSTLEALNPWERVEVNYYLHARPGRFETVVTGRRDRHEVSRQTLDVVEVQKTPGTLGDSLKVLQSLPGVARTPFGAGSLIVRGQGPRDSKLYLDGIELPVLFHFGALISVYPSTMLRRIDLYPGGFPSQFGRASAGVVDVETRDPRTDRLHGQVDINVLDASLLLEGPIGKQLSFVISGRRSYFDAFLPLILPSGAASDLAVAPRYYDFQAKLIWKVPSPGPWRHELALLFFGADDAARFLSENDRGALFEQRGTFANEVTFLRLGARWRASHGTSTQLEVVPFYGFDRSLLKIGRLPYVQDLVTHTFGLRQNTRHDFNKWLTLRAGLDWLVGGYALESNVPVAARPGMVRSPLADLGNEGGRTTGAMANLGFWAELRLRLGPRLELIPGARLDYYQTSREVVADPRLALRWTVAEKTTLKAASGLYHRPPTLLDSDPVQGNPQLRSTWTFQNSAGFEQRFWRLQLDVVLFYNDLRDVPVPAGTYVQGPGGSRYVPPANLGLSTAQSLNQFSQGYQVNDGRGRTYGAELLLRYPRQSRFFGWLAYTVLKSELTDGPGLPYRPYQYDQTHILALVGSMQLGRGWEVGLRFRLVSGNPYTPTTGRYFDSDRNVYAPRSGPINSDRLPLFHQLDLRVEKSFIYKLWKLEVYLDVQNVYSYRAAEAVQYSFDFGQRQFLEGLPIIPAFGARGTF